jgi:hypothetical protein
MGDFSREARDFTKGPNAVNVLLPFSGLGQWSEFEYARSDR